MSAKIKDLVEILPVRNASADGRDDADAATASLLITYEIGDAITRVVERVAIAEQPPRNCLLVGSSGCGKSTLLAAASTVVALDVDAPAHPRLLELRSVAGNARAHSVRVGRPGAERSLGAAVERAVAEHAATHGLAYAETGPTARLDMVASVAGGLASGDRLFLAIDDLDDWLRGSGRFAFENLQSLVRLGELSRVLPVTTCAVAGSGVLYDEAHADDGRGWMAALHADFQIEYVPSHIIRTATASHVLRKNARQRREILDVLRTLREKLPELTTSDDEFIELYPLEVSTWTIGGHLHRWIPAFSFPEFAARAADSVKGRPGSSLFALNDMFTHYERQLRRVDSLAPIFSVYDGLLAEAIPELGQSQRLWATLALQSVFMHTIAGISVDVITLTNSVLLYNLHGSGSSYVFMGAVLKQLETLGRGKIVAAGEGPTRRYSLVTGQREAVLARVEELADAVVDDDEVTWAMFAFGGRIFADWPLSLGSAKSSVRSSVWEVSQGEGSVTLRPVGLGGDDEERPSLVIFAPGRSWSEAREEVMRQSNAVGWIGGAITPAGTSALKKWIAVSRMSDDERYARFADVADLRNELERQAAAVFRRTYVERGTLVTPDRSEQVDLLVHASREENLVSRFLPAEAAESAAAGGQSRGTGPLILSNGLVRPDVAEWLAYLTAPEREAIEAYAEELDKTAWRKRLESWYAAGVGRDLSVPAARFGGAALDVPPIAAALEAKQQLDVALFNVRKTLGAGSVSALREALESVFDSPDALWDVRRRVDWLEGLVAFLATVDRTERYLRESETIDGSDVETFKAALYESLENPRDLVDEERRDVFAATFEAFRDAYAARYAAEHDKGVGPEVIDRLSHAIIESQGWRALEALSSLSVSNPSYLVEATNLVSMLREARCDADVAAAMRELPRCACGFRIGDRSRIAALASSAAELIQTGIKHHRRALQLRKDFIRERIKQRKTAFGIETIKQIAALIADDEIPEIAPETIAALDEILESAEA